MAIGATAAMVGMAGLQLAGAATQANAARAQGEYQKAMSEINARNAELMAQKRMAKGEEEAALYGRKVRSIIGSQKTAYASQGVSLDSDVAKDIQTTTFEIGLEDVQNIRTNAYLEAMGYQSQGQDMLRQGRMAKTAGETAAFGTMLGGIAGAASTIYSGMMKVPKTETKSGPNITASEGVTTSDRGIRNATSSYA